MGDCLTGAPCPHPLLFSALPGCGAEPGAATPSLGWIGVGWGRPEARSSSRARFVRCALPSTSGEARGWGREASALAFPTPRPRAAAAAGGGPGAVGVLGGCGGCGWSCNYSCLSGELRMRGPHLLLGGGSSPSLCTALPRAEEGSWLEEGAINIYK